MVRQCPKCKTSEYNNRALVMLVNECAHPLCRNCVENIFVRNLAKCPNEECSKMLMKKNYRVQLFDDPMIERETFIRKRLNKIYNLHEDDFNNLRDFNDYLEHIEDIVFRLVHEIEVEETETEVKSFKEQYADAIERNRRRLTADEIWISQMIEEEQKRLKRLRDEENIEIAKNGDALLNPRAIIEELRESKLPAEVILDKQRKQQIVMEKAEKEEAERKKKLKHKNQRHAQTFGTLQRTGKAYVHSTPRLNVHGPPMLTPDEICTYGYLNHVRQATPSQLAGGFTAFIGCARAILESRQDLFTL